MTVLTWRDVGVPNLGSGVEGIRAAGEMFDRAMQSAKGVVGSLKAQQNDAADSAVLSDLLRYQGTPDALMADLGSGAFQSRHNLSKISATMREYLAKAPGELLEFAVKKSAFDENQKSIADQDHLRANRAVINPWIDAVRTGNDAAAKQIMTANPDVFSKMDTGKYLGMVRSGQDLFGDDVNNDGNAFNNAVRQTEWGEDRVIGQVYQDAITEAPDSNPEMILNQKRDEIIAKHGEYVFSRLLARARAEAGGGAGAGAPGGTGAALGSAGIPGPATGIGGKNLYDVVLGDQPNGGNAYGFAPPKPVSQMSMGELYNYQRSVMIPATKAKGVGGGLGSSAAGAYQIVSKTLASAAPKVFGANWQNVPFTPENQDKLGEYLFNEAKANGTDLHKVWEGLPRGTSPAGLTWADARGMITKAESGGVAELFERGTGPGARQAAINASTIMQQTLSGDPMIETARTFQDVWQDKSSARAVAQKLTSKGGPFEGQNTDAVTNFIKRIQQRGGGNINAAMAGRIAEITDKGGEGGLAAFFDGWANPFSDGLKHNYDWKEIDQHVKMLKNPRALADAMNKLDQIGQSQVGMNQAAAALADVTTKMRAAQMAKARAGRPWTETDQNYWNSLLIAAGAQNGAAVTNGAVTTMSTYRDQTGAQPKPKAAVPAPSRSTKPDAAAIIAAIAAQGRTSPLLLDPKRRK